MHKPTAATKKHEVVILPAIVNSFKLMKNFTKAKAKMPNLNFFAFTLLNNQFLLNSFIFCHQLCGLLLKIVLLQQWMVAIDMLQHDVGAIYCVTRHSVCVIHFANACIRRTEFPAASVVAPSCLLLADASESFNIDS